ncbi:hypothetical protein NUSPORA_00883 [Nucleospora cyclopteri]
MENSKEIQQKSTAKRKLSESEDEKTVLEGNVKKSKIIQNEELNTELLNITSDTLNIDNTKQLSKIASDLLNNREEYDLDQITSFLEAELEKTLVDIKKEQKSDFCDHTIRIGILCAKCGKEVAEDELLVNATHNSDQIMQTQEAAIKESIDYFNRLKEQNKLVLILDLDQTLIQSSLTKAPCDETFSFGNSTFYVKIRPFALRFIREISKFYELHVYTMGTREYAEKICKILDPTGKFFGERIVTRTENNNELKKTIQRITPFSKNVLIVDDRLDVWNFIPNVLLIRPFCYFNLLDINDPTKISNDNASFIEKAENWLEAVIRDLNEEEFANEYKNILRKSVNTENILISSENEKIIREGEKFIKSHVELNKEDREIKQCYKVLRKAHRRFFRALQRKNLLETPVSSQENIPCVSNFIKLRFLKGLTFICKPIYQKHIIFLGGNIASSINDKTLKYVINDRDVAEKHSLINVSDFWLWECLYQRKYVDIEEYFIE